MIRKLTGSDNEAVMPFLRRAPEQNLFFIGGIHNNGYECDYQELWGDFTADGKLRAALIRYYHYYTVAAYGEHDAEGFAQICSQDKEFNLIAGMQANIEGYLRYISGLPRKMCFARLEKLTDFARNDISVIQATAADAPEIIALLSGVEEFPCTNPQQVLNSMINNESRFFIAREDGKIVANATAVAENPYSAMIEDVACCAEKRGKGYATACVRKLCEVLLAEGKTLCLYFDNPAAGGIYYKLGFVDAGCWMQIKGADENDQETCCR